jgi:hypothetical protein
MNAQALIRLLARRSVVATFAALVLLAVAIALLDREFRGGVPFVMFVFVYNVAGAGFLLALGSFLARAANELGSIHIARTIPGLRRNVNVGVIGCALVMPVGGVLFLRFMLPEQFAVVPLGTMWALHVFLFSLGVGLSWSWLLPSVLGVLAVKFSALLPVLRTSPWTVATIALVVSCALLAVWHRRFLGPLPSTKGKPRRHWGWLSSPFAPSAPVAIRSEKSLRDRPGWRLPDQRIFSLVRAGAYERLGHRRGGQSGAMISGLLCVFFVFALVIHSASRAPNTGGFTTFARLLLSGDASRYAILHHLFAVLIGGMAYVTAVTHDGTLRPTLWHPISRLRHATVVFVAHLRQNVLFAGIAVLFAGLAILWATHGATLPSTSALRAFLLPPVFAFILMPIPQALFPNGPEAFHRRVNPLKQLTAGLLGGGFALLTAYWTANWPSGNGSELMSGPLRGTLLLNTAVAIYGGYFLWLRHHYVRADLRPRLT